METRDILLILCSIGGIQSLFWGVYLFVQTVKNSSSKLLGGLFLAFAIRIIKSTLWLFYDHVHLIILNIGFAAHAAIGPFLWLYLRSHSSNLALHKRDILHFVPALGILLFSNQLELNTFWYSGGYTALAGQSIVYFALSAIWFYRQQEEFKQKAHQWAILLLLGTGAVLAGYFTNYISGPIIYSFVIYIFSFYLLVNLGSLFNGKRKYRNINISKDLSSDYKRKIESHFETNQPFLSNEYTLGSLSQEVEIPKHLLSSIFSTQFQMSFSDYVNSHRIEQAKRMLNDHSHLTVASIAYDCGFNTLSSFNQAFKKFVKTTPSKYRQRML